MNAYSKLNAPSPVKMGPVVAGKTKADHNRYCGPAVISCLTGCTTGEAAYLVRKINRRKMVTGCTAHELHRVLRSFGIQPVLQLNANEERPTLAAWLRSTHGTRAGRTFLIEAGQHWQLVSGNQFVCGITKEIVSTKHEKVKRRCRVRAVWEINMEYGSAAPLKPIHHPLLMARIEEKKAKATEAKIGPLAMFRKLAIARGWKWELAYDDFLEIEECEEFPCGFTTFHYDWHESLRRVEYCLEHPEMVSDEGYYSE